ncbi:hypothetical protein [Hoylesella timonensis]|nr:hypothetical protein [Hoylesella timonensis]
MNKIYCPYPLQPSIPLHPLVAIYAVPLCISATYKHKKASSIG